MAHDVLVTVSYPVDGEFTRINADVLDGQARVVFLHGRPDDQHPAQAASLHFLDIFYTFSLLSFWGGAGAHGTG